MQTSDIHDRRTLDILDRIEHRNINGECPDEDDAVDYRQMMSTFANKELADRYQILAVLIRHGYVLLTPYGHLHLGDNGVELCRLLTDEAADGLLEEV